MSRINLSQTLLGALCSLGLCAMAYAADHVDGPRVIGDPPADITDVFAFPSPERQGHLVLIMDVNPYAGDDTRFSEALDYSFIVRRAEIIPGRDAGDKPGFSTDRELRITCNVDAPEADGADQPLKQRLTCNGLGEEPVVAWLNDLAPNPETNERARLFAGLRSEPFFLDLEAMDSFTVSETLPGDKGGINFLQNANVLSIVLELDMRPYYAGDTLFAIAAETGTKGHPGTRIDRMGRAEVTNVFLAVAAHTGLDDHDTLKDLYNSEATFDVLEDNLGRYRDRLYASLFFYDRFDGELDWRLQPGRLPIVDILLQDHLVVDIAQPCPNDSYLEIERAILRGAAHQSCGGRRPNDDIYSATNTLLIEGLRMDADRLIVVGVDAPTRWAEATWPYLAAPNSQRAETAVSVVLNAACDDVWAEIGDFASLADWYPGVAKFETGGQGVGETRSVYLKNGAHIVEQLQTVDAQGQGYTYAMLSGPLPVANYTGTLKAKSVDDGNSCDVVWSSEFDVNGAPKFAVIGAVNGIFSAGLNSLETQFGARQSSASERQ